MQLTVLFQSDGLHGMLKRKDNQNIDMVFRFICAFVNGSTRCMEDQELMEVSSLYSDLFVETHGGSWSGRGKFYKRLMLSIKLVKKIKERTVCEFKTFSNWI